MTAQEAYEIVKHHFPKKEFYKCVEYENIFVFQEVELGIDPKFAPFDGLWSIDKVTEEIRNFNPFDLSIDETKKGKTVEDFKYNP